MGIQQNESLFHWNYFLALEADLVDLSRYIEFDESNFESYSIEMARLLQSACSEVDVLAYEICQYLDDRANAERIDQYRPLLRQNIPELEAAVVNIPRYGLKLTPWVNWKSNVTPDWWVDHNKVKHHRNDNFEKANLKNVLNATAGLLLLVINYYKLLTSFGSLNPPPNLFRVERDFAPVELFLGLGMALVLKESN